MFNTLQVKCLGLILSNGFLKSKTYFYNKGLSLFLNCTVPLFILHYVGTVTFFLFALFGEPESKMLAANGNQSKYGADTEVQEFCQKLCPKKVLGWSVELYLLQHCQCSFQLSWSNIQFLMKTWK